MSIELDPAVRPVAEARVDRPSRRTRPAGKDRGIGPWARDRAEWDSLEPTGVYARRLREPWLFLLTLLLALPALLLAVPIALVNALVQQSPRRVLFAQPRVGRRGRIFLLVKFRTMRASAPGEVERVTPFGRFLRDTHLDELPQLLHVLSGDMCLIGARPEMVPTERWAARHFPAFAERLVLRPGLTGLAQVTQGYTDRGDLPAYHRKHELNRRYREELGFGLDCRILARTAVRMLCARGGQRG